MACLDVLNFVTVTLYGCIIMILFMNETENKLHICGLFAICLLGGILNLVLRQKFSNGILYMTYPLTVHLPLLLYFIFVMKNSVYGAIFALTAAYTLTTPRKWLCILVTHLLGGGALAEAAAEIGVSVVLLLLIAKFMSKIVRKIFAGGPKEAKYLCILPAAVYVITYATTVYSDFLMSRPNITIPVLTTALSVFFIGFEIYFFDYAFERVNIRHSKQLADLQLRSVERLAECIGGGETRELGFRERIPKLTSKMPNKTIPVTEDEWKVLRLTNKERAKQGLYLLTMSGPLQYACDIREEEALESFSYTRPDGTKFSTAISQSFKHNIVGENLHHCTPGHENPERAVTDWMNSPGHRENIL